VESHIKSIGADTGTGSKSVRYFYDPSFRNASNVTRTKRITHQPYPEYTGGQSTAEKANTRIT